MATFLILMGLIDGASATDIDAILPEVPGDISCAFAVDYGTPGHKRRILRRQAREAVRTGKAKQLHEAWKTRLAAAATKAMRAGRSMPAKR